jgi:hypothetical protein
MVLAAVLLVAGSLAFFAFLLAAAVLDTEAGA